MNNTSDIKPTQKTDPVFFSPKQFGDQYPIPSSWISTKNDIYVLIDYYYPDTESLCQNKPSGVLLYSVKTEKRKVHTYAEFHQRVSRGSLIRVTEIAHG